MTHDMPAPAITLRPARLTDADRLLAWRNDPATRKASHRPHWISLSDHKNWLQAVLNDPDRRLLIGEENGTAIGTIRADQTKTGCCLSWTIAPEARGRGLAGIMIRKLSRQINGPLWAEVRTDNPASAHIARQAGFELDHEADDIFYFTRKGDPSHEQS